MEKYQSVESPDDRNSLPGPATNTFGGSGRHSAAVAIVFPSRAENRPLDTLLYQRATLYLASAALPPSSKTRLPASAARGCSQTAAPRVPNTVERPRSRDASPVGLSSPSPVCNSLHSLSVSCKGIVGYSKGKYIRRLILGSAKGIYVGGTLISILLSLYLFVSGRRETGIFVGLWAPTVLNLGQTLFEDDES